MYKTAEDSIKYSFNYYSRLFDRYNQFVQVNSACLVLLMVNVFLETVGYFA